jgi:penicillin-binding protein 1A
MTSILRDVITRGTGRGNGIGRPVAGKTGTTSDYKDTWFVGFSPSIATGVYVGYDLPKTIFNGASGGKTAGPIWRRYMEQAHAGRPMEDFTPSAEVMREIEAEERMNILAELQNNPAGAAAALASLRSGNSPIQRAAARAGASGNDDVIDDGPRYRNKGNRARNGQKARSTTKQRAERSTRG